MKLVRIKLRAGAETVVNIEQIAYVQEIANGTRWRLSGIENPLDTDMDLGEAMQAICEMNRE